MIPHKLPFRILGVFTKHIPRNIFYCTLVQKNFYFLFFRLDYIWKEYITLFTVLFRRPISQMVTDQLNGIPIKMKKRLL